MTALLDRLSGPLLAADEFYVDLLDVPVETPPADIDDAVLESYENNCLPNEAGGIQVPDEHVLISTPKEVRNIVVPLRRMLSRGMTGRDVFACQRAMVRTGIRKQRPVNSFGDVFVKQVHQFQDQRGLEVDGIIGSQTFARLLPFFDAYGEWLMLHASITPKVSADHKARLAIEAAALFGWNHASAIHYTQGPLRMEWTWLHAYPPPRYDRYYDCSSYVTWCYRCANVVDPNGYKRPPYPGCGYTGTLIQNGRRIDPGDAQRGDLTFYGPGTRCHVVVMVGDKGTQRCVSHGSEGGPYLTRYDYRGDFAECRSYPMTKI